MDSSNARMVFGHAKLLLVRWDYGKMSNTDYEAYILEVKGSDWFSAQWYWQHGFNDKQRTSFVFQCGNSNCNDMTVSTARCDFGFDRVCKWFSSISVSIAFNDNLAMCEWFNVWGILVLNQLKIAWKGSLAAFYDSYDSPVTRRFFQKDLKSFLSHLIISS